MAYGGFWVWQQLALPGLQEATLLLSHCHHSIVLTTWLSGYVGELFLRSMSKSGIVAGDGLIDLQGIRFHIAGLNGQARHHQSRCSSRHFWGTLLQINECRPWLLWNTYMRDESQSGWQAVLVHWARKKHLALVAAGGTTELPKAGDEQIQGPTKPVQKASLCSPNSFLAALV